MYDVIGLIYFFCYLFLVNHVMNLSDKYLKDEYKQGNFWGYKFRFNPNQYEDIKGLKYRWLAVFIALMFPIGGFIIIGFKFNLF